MINRAVFLLPLSLLLAACGEGRAARTHDEAARPKRIVSMNPCIDAVLMDVADPDQIAAISHYSRDPRSTSIDLTAARRFAAVGDGAEEIIAQRPDLVIAGGHVDPKSIAALRQLGIPLLQLPVPQTVEENMAQISTIAARIGQAAKGEALNRRIETALGNAAQAAKGKPPVRALIWQGNGLVPGKGTLADELMARAGFDNVSTALGLAQWDILPLEQLLSHPPQVLLAGRADMSASDSDGGRMLSHPALAEARTHMEIANFPSRLLHCGGPVIIATVGRLQQIRALADSGERARP